MRKTGLDSGSATVPVAPFGVPPNGPETGADAQLCGSDVRPEKDAGCRFPLPAGEGEGERDAANQDGRTNFASSTRAAPRANSMCCQKQISRRALSRTGASRQARWCFERCFPLTPALSRGERENRPPRFRQSRASRLVAARDVVSPLPAGEGQGEGEPDAANQDGRTNFKS